MGYVSHRVGIELSHSKLARLHTSLGRDRAIRIHMCSGVDFHHAGLLAGSKPFRIFRGELIVDLRDELPYYNKHISTTYTCMGAISHLSKLRSANKPAQLLREVSKGCHVTQLCRLYIYIYTYVSSCV